VPTVRCYVGLGANVGDARRTLIGAVAALAAMPGVSLAGVSSLYVTAPVKVLDQPDFQNAVVALDVPAGPDAETGALALLAALKSIERAFGRHERFRHGPRELDLDLLLFGDSEICVERPPQDRSADPSRPPTLVVPHAEARNRLFVLAPLSELAPNLIPPGWDESVAEARVRREAIEGVEAARPAGRWNPERRGWD
jgi:2-amino-4-hydroxy-6-hydroxymethyldihydropteridine diphosphokinase